MLRSTQTGWRTTGMGVGVGTVVYIENMADGQEEFVIAEGMGLKNERVDKAAVRAKEIGKNQIARAKVEALPFDKEMTEFLPAAKDLVTEYYSKLGIRGYLLVDNVFQQKVIGGDPNTLGITKAGPVVIIKQSIISSSHELNNFMKARVIAHESYHGGAQAKLRLDHKDSDELVMEKGGLDYIGDKPAAIEEGLAVRFEVWATNRIGETFVKGKAMFDGLIEVYRGSIPVDLPVETYRAIDSNEEPVLSASYRRSYELVRFLEQEVTDFILLAEKARINHETVALARVIEKRFGKGMYKRIMETTEETAKEMLESLKEETGR